MVPSLSLALSLIRLRRNERIKDIGGKLSAFSRMLARTVHSDDASTYAIVGQWWNSKWSIVRGRSRAWHFALRVHLGGPPGRYSRRAQLMQPASYMADTYTHPYFQGHFSSAAGCIAYAAWKKITSQLNIHRRTYRLDLSRAIADIYQYYLIIIRGRLRF